MLVPVCSTATRSPALLATPATLTSNIGNYGISQGTLAASANYALSYVGANLTVTAAPLTVTADAQTRLYGAANPTLTYTDTGLVNGDTLSGLLATPATLTSNVGAYAITQGTLAASSNYALTYVGANLTVTAAPLTVTADAQSRLYGAANPTLTYVSSGLVNGDTLSGLLATTATATSNVGPYAITQGTLAASSNYALTYVGANLTVTAAPLTVTADAQSMVYGSTVPTLTYVSSGLVNGDTLSGLLATSATTTSNVGSYAITQGTLAASANYALSYVGAHFAVTAAPLTVTANAQSRIYGGANPTLTYTDTGLLNGDTLSGLLATTATGTSNVGNYAITQGTLAASANYALSYVGANLTVTAAPLTVTANAQSMVYGGTVPVLTYIETGLVNGDTLSGLLATTATVTSNIGAYAITQGTLANSNYSIAYTGANLTVTAAALTVTANAQTMAYGSTVPALAYVESGLVNGDTLSGLLATTATTTANVGNYAISQGTLAASANYALSYVGANLTVTAAPLTVTANAQSRIYGGANPTLTYTDTGLVNGDTLSGLLATIATATSNVGNYGITQGTLTSSANYALSYVGANLTVTAAPLTVTANAQSRIYGNANPSLTYVSSGLVNGDTLSGLLATTASTTSNVGNYTITQGTLAASANYALSYVAANLAVTAAPLTVTANAQSRIYGGANPTLTYVSSGLLNGDTLSGLLATRATATSNVGSYGISQGTLAASANYALSYVGANLAVASAPLTVTANAQTMVYGSAIPALTYIETGLVNGDTLSGLLATTATGTSNVGSYGISRGTLAATSNYALSYVGANLAVTAAPLTVTANAQTRLYGAANPTLTYTDTGLVNGDTLSGLLATTATTTSNVGNYGISQGTLAASANYALSYVGANLTVTAAPLTVTANAQSRLYGGANPTLTYTETGLLNGDTLAGALATTATTTSNVGSYGISQGTLAASANYALSYVGANLAVTAAPLTVTANAQTMVYGSAVQALTYVSSGLVNGGTLSGLLATTATAKSNVGNYGISQGTLAASANYALSYVGANLTVTAAALTVTANAQSKIYGNANPTLTYIETGLVNGDTLSGLLVTTATTTSNVGNYAITQGTLAASANYALSYVGANLAVTAAPLTVTADAQSRIYGAANPTLTYVSSGLLNGDTLSGLLVTTATATSNVGNYGITQGTLAASANYALSYVGANLAVTAAPLTVTADAQSRIYGTANPTLTYVSSGLLNGDTLSGLLATTATGTSNVGNYAITQGTLAVSANYALSYVGANLTVTAAPLTVSADAQTRIYGNANPTLTYVSSGLVNGDALSGLLATTATTTSNIGNYGISQGTLAATSNYALSYVGANLTVTAAAPAVTVNAQSPEFPSYFLSNDFLSTAVANLADDTDTPTCMPVGVLRSLNRYGRVDLTGGSAASCKLSF